MICRQLIVCFFYVLSCSIGYAQESYVLQYRLNGSGGITQQGFDYFVDSLSRARFSEQWIRNFQMDGFLNAKIAERYFNGDTLSLVIQKGEQYQWLELRRGNLQEEMPGFGNIEAGGFKGKKFSMIELSSLFEVILQTSQNNGFPFANIRLDSIKLDGKLVSAAIAYDYGPFITWDTLNITGNSKTKPVFLSRYLHLKPGTAFSQKKVDQIIQRLKNLPFVHLIKEPELSFQNNEATVYLPLNDRKMNTLDGIIGFLPNAIEENTLLVTGQFDLALYNIGGRARNFLLSWQRLSQFSQNLNLTLEEPLLLGSLLDLKASFYLLKEDTSFLNRDFRMDLGHRISPKSYLSFFTRRQAGDLLSVAGMEDVNFLPDVADFRYNNYGLQYSFNSMDVQVFPRKGWASHLEFGIGNKRILQNTGLPEAIYENAELNTIQFYIKASWEKMIFVSPRFGAMVKISGGELNNSNLFLNDLYRLGGLKSIRGFNENYFFTNRYVYANFEPRYYFDTNSYFLFFSDWARLQNNTGIGSKEKPFSFGGGISLDTNSGIFNFIYALGSSNEQPIGFNFSRVHFGYTGRF